MSQISRGSVWKMEKKAFFATKCEEHSRGEVEDSLKERLNDFQRNTPTFPLVNKQDIISCLQCLLIRL